MVYRNILLQCFSVLAFWCSGAAVTLYWFVILGSGLWQVVYSCLFWVLELESFTNILPGRIYSFSRLRPSGTVLVLDGPVVVAWSVELGDLSLDWPGVICRRLTCLFIKWRKQFISLKGARTRKWDC